MGVLRFRLFGAAVHIRPDFWVVVALLVLSTQRPALLQVVLGLTLLLTILFHELGHALVAKRFGLSPVVVVHAFGGVTSFLPGVPVSRAMAIRIALAGPATGLALALLGLFALKFAPVMLHHPLPEPTKQALLEFMQINGFWSAINLLPLMPFDGGQVLIYLLGPERQIVAARVSLVFGCAAAIVLYKFGLTLAALVFLFSSVIQYFSVRRATAVAESPVPLRQLELLLAQARGALENGDHESAARISRAVVESAPTSAIRRQAAEVYAWAALGMSQQGEARRALEWMSDGALDPLLQAALLEADGDAERAIHCLRQARTVGDERAQVAASLVRLLLGADRYGEAALTTIQILDHVTPEEARLVVVACRDGGRPVPAAELSEALFARTGLVSDLLDAVASYVAAGNTNTACSTLALALGGKVSVLDVETCPTWTTLAQDSSLAMVLAETRSRVVH